MKTGVGGNLLPRIGRSWPMRGSIMGRLFGFIFILVGTVLAGSAVIAALTIGRDSGADISVAAVVGAIVALPVAWLISRKLETVR